jgi:hypothetical protein
MKSQQENAAGFPDIANHEEASHYFNALKDKCSYYQNWVRYLKEIPKRANFNAQTDGKELEEAESHFASKFDRTYAMMTHLKKVMDATPKQNKKTLPQTQPSRQNILEKPLDFNSSNVSTEMVPERKISNKFVGK